MEKLLKNSIEKLKESKDIMCVLEELNGWYSTDKNGNFVAIRVEAKVHENIKNALMNKALLSLSEKDREKLQTLFKHKSHFLEGVTKKEALYYYFNSPDFKINYDKNSISGGVGKITVSMVNFYRALEDVVSSLSLGLLTVSLDEQNTVIIHSVSE